MTTSSYNFLLFIYFLFYQTHPLEFNYSSVNYWLRHYQFRIRLFYYFIPDNPADDVWASYAEELLAILSLLRHECNNGFWLSFICDIVSILITVWKFRCLLDTWVFNLGMLLYNKVRLLYKHNLRTALRSWGETPSYLNFIFLPAKEKMRSRMTIRNG